MSGKSQTIGDFTFCRSSQILPISRTICPRFSRDAMFIWDRGTGAQQSRGLVMSEIHSRHPRWNKFEFSFFGNDRRPSQKSGTHWENRNAPDSPDLSPSILDDRGCLRFRVFISRQNLGQSGNSKIPWSSGIFPTFENQALVYYKDAHWGNVFLSDNFEKSHDCQ